MFVGPPYTILCFSGELKGQASTPSVDTSLSTTSYDPVTDVNNTAPSDSNSGIMSEVISYNAGDKEATFVSKESTKESINSYVCVCICMYVW